ncbi:CDP-glycerol glycerophosphotransferase family protein [Planococcus sp. MERTA32b]|nr:CDP-glycerol glycerophosphotransferase family protein [Planococcus sp. MER TA 32b]
MKIYNKSVQLLDKSGESIDFLLMDSEELYHVKFSDLKVKQPILLGTYPLPDQILLTREIFESTVIVYIADGEIWAAATAPETKEYKPHHFHFEFDCYTDLVSYKQTAETSFTVLDQNGNSLFTIHDLVTAQTEQHVYPIDLGLTTIDYRFLTLGKVQYGQFNMFIVYDLFRKELTLNKVVLSFLSDITDFEFELTDLSTLEITYKGEPTVINLKKITSKGKKLFKPGELQEYRNKHILTVFKVNGAKYFIHNKTAGVYLTRTKPTKISGFRSDMISRFVGKNLYIAGRNTHYAYKANGVYDNLYIGDHKEPIAKFVRPLNIKFFRRYGYFKVPVDRLHVNNRIHTNLYLGDDKAILHNLKLKTFPRKGKTLDFTVNGDQVNVIRTNLRGDITSTIINFSPEYSFINRNKIYAASVISKFFNNKKSKINLYFEKKSMKADESSIRVFEKVMQDKEVRSKNYFILSDEASNYEELKAKYKKAIVKKHSFRHYLLTFRASNLISSELSNHLLNDRLYIDVIRERINSIPLTFLQHGIMFAKPVDNPMAFGFHKDKNVFNMHKSVISSELEAGEFYKMGYDRSDLLLTGLATFDHARLNEGADKIAFMPTYRYWEEGFIYRGLIEQTSYYRQIMRVIEAFKAHGLLDRLLIVPHNKFSEHIYENMKEYQHIISANPSEALKEAVIFITDYSSAIYDATFRGAYPIFYWEEKDYLIEQYKAIPPVNDDNAPGAIAYTIDELMASVKNAISRNYQLDEEIRYKYLQINSFEDRQNTGRIIEYLKKDDIL